MREEDRIFMKCVLTALSDSSNRSHLAHCHQNIWLYLENWLNHHILTQNYQQQSHHTQYHPENERTPESRQNSKNRAARPNCPIKFLKESDPWNCLQRWGTQGKAQAEFPWCAFGLDTLVWMKQSRSQSLFSSNAVMGLHDLFSDPNWGSVLMRCSGPWLSLQTCLCTLGEETEMMGMSHDRWWNDSAIHPPASHQLYHFWLQ